MHSTMRSARYNNGFPAFVDKAVNGVFHKRTGVRYLTVFRKDGVMPLIQQGDKLFVIVKDIAVILRSPVDVHLIRIIRKTGIIDIGCSFGSFFAETVRHDKKIFDIWPVDPDGEQVLAVVYPIGNNSVDFDYVVAELCARFF